MSNIFHWLGSHLEYSVTDPTYFVSKWSSLKFEYLQKSLFANRTQTDIHIYCHLIYIINELNSKDVLVWVYFKASNSEIARNTLRCLQLEESYLKLFIKSIDGHREASFVHCSVDGIPVFPRMFCIIHPV